ncbi:sugar kinase [Psychromonas hadalis]|uniref:sugar kinase n=1 Tax=Psychromonas hadalis TaxID=211669 RepID=UPI0003B598B4|nr:sugar kinase [Psychromonas hadalis]
MIPITSVAIIGECMVELKKVAGSVDQSFGGDTLNTAVYLSRLTRQQGITTSYVTGLGKDPFSKEMIDAWQKEGINTEMVYQSTNKLPGMYAIETEDDGERRFFYWRNDSAAKYWIREHSQQSLIKKLSAHQVIYLSGISLAILADDCRECLITVLTECHKAGVKIAFDNNYRPALWKSAEQAQFYYQQILAITDMAFLTFDDEQMLYGDQTEQQTIERTQQLGVKEIVIKRGGDACLVVENNEVNAIEPKPIDNIVDTTAAGDSFSAGYLAKRLLGGSLQESAIAGHNLAGQVIQHHGAIISNELMPTI